MQAVQLPRKPPKKPETETTKTRITSVRGQQREMRSVRALAEQLRALWGVQSDGMEEDVKQGDGGSASHKVGTATVVAAT